MREVIRSSPKPVDHSWRERFKATPGLRDRAMVEFRTQHTQIHAAANSLFRCPVCHGWPGLEVAD